DQRLHPGKREHHPIDGVEAEPGAWRAQARHLIKQMRADLIREIREQPLKQPDSGLLRLETGLQKRVSPESCEISRNGGAQAPWMSTRIAQDLLFVCQDLLLIYLEKERVVWPREPISPCIQTSRQQHDLAQRRRGDCAQQEIIEKAYPHNGADAGISGLLLRPCLAFWTCKSFSPRIIKQAIRALTFSGTRSGSPASGHGETMRRREVVEHMLLLETNFVGRVRA